jgi:hypothetical protein
MGVYDRQIAQVRRQVKAKGQLVTWVSVSNVTPADANKPWASGANASPAPEHMVYIAFLPAGGGSYNALVAALARMAGAKELATGTLNGLMAPDASFVPDETDVVRRINPRTGVAENLRINTLELLAPNGEPILYSIGFAE